MILRSFRAVLFQVSLFCFIVLHFSHCAARAGLLINEVLTAADARDFFDTAGDWVELFNNSDDRISLKGFCLTDTNSLRHRWPLPDAVLQPGGFYVVLLDGQGGTILPHYRISADFSLSDRGDERLTLLSPDGRIADSLNVPRLPRNCSFGRLRDGLARWVLFTSPTPHAPNRGPAVDRTLPVPVWKPPPGVYSRGLTLAPVERPGLSIEFTANGSDPHPGCASQAPPIHIDKTTVIRSRYYDKQGVAGPLASSTFIINGNNIHPLPIVSVSMPPCKMFCSPKGLIANPLKRGRHWEKKAFFEYFNESGRRLVACPAGIRVHGGCSRTIKTDKKSFRLYLDDGRIDPGRGRPRIRRIFPGSSPGVLSTLVLRAEINETFVADPKRKGHPALLVRNVLADSLFSALDYPVTCGRLVEVFLCARYWGIYHLCERVDSRFLERRFGFPCWDIVEDGSLIEGSPVRWLDFLAWLNKFDARVPSQYRQAFERVDINSFTDYVILNLWVDNCDWPDKNWYAVRPRIARGRWRFIPWDIDYCLAGPVFNLEHFRTAIEKTTKRQQKVISALLSKLLQNKRYRALFLARLKQVCEVLDSDFVKGRADYYFARLRPVIDKEIQLWCPLAGSGLKLWRYKREELYKFIADRNRILLDFVQKEFFFFNGKTENGKLLNLTLAREKLRKLHAAGGRH